MALDITVERIDTPTPVTVIALDGELDASNFTELVRQVQELYAAGTRVLVLDLAGLRFMASSGLVALHSIVGILRGEAPDDPEAGWQALHSVGLDASGAAEQRDVRLCSVQPGVQRVLDRTGLDRLFHVHPDRASALAAIADAGR